MADSINPLSRRRLLQSTALAIGAGAIRCVPVEAVEPPKGKAFRVAHLTDMHVQPERNAGEGFAQALRSLDKLNPKPDLLITGGDHVFDAMAQTPERCKVVWDLYQKVLMDNTSLPVRPVLGNHDVAGWNDPKKFAKDLPGFGKVMTLERLGLDKPYYSFDAGGWHFCMLDSVALVDPGYRGRFDPEQMEWLKADLEKTGKDTPVCFVSHIPVLSVGIFFFDNKIEDKNRLISNALLHCDTADVMKLIKPYRNVKLLMSGHLHLVDRCDYDGRTYLCNGAVSGAWWKGPHQQFAEGYGIVDFYPDGSFENQYATYGWKAQA